EAFQERFRENTSRYLDPFRQRMQGVVANAANATGREMRAVNFTASTSIQEVPRRWGLVTYQFMWTNFAAQQNETLAVGDVFQGGFFLAANDSLEIEAPTEYEISRVEPTPDSRDDGVVTWVGREDFANRHPRVVFNPTTESQQPGEQSPTPDGATSSPFGRIGLGAVLGGVLLLTLVGIGAYIGWRRRTDSGGTEHPASTSANVNQDSPAQAPTGEDAPGDDTSAGGAVMTDPERVQALLEANGGRMRQASIADEFDWSASKTSRVIGNMVDEGTIEKLQLGRENLIEIADADE
ncbi:MAG: helix-turn-helix transcriptional regulator, partial [Halorhabdus sp.]